MAQVVVTIDGKTYRMACGEGEEAHLEALAERFDRSLGQLREAFGSIGDQRLTVMTGISVMDQLVDTETKLAAREKELAEIKRMRDEGAEEVGRTETELSDRLGGLAERIEGLARSIGERGRSAGEGA